MTASAKPTTSAPDSAAAPDPATPPAPAHPPRVLSIAGSDPSGGAGIQADLKAFSALGAYGMCVITALTAQNTQAVTGVHEVPPDFVAAQLETLLADVQVDAVKIGMLANADIARRVTEFLVAPPLSRVPIVLDPVMVSTSGARLLDDAATDAIRDLIRHAGVITPNLGEAAVLTGRPVAQNLAQMREQAQQLLADGAARVLLKGGHLDAEPDAVDLLAWPGGEKVLRTPRIHTRNTHGTGCSLSSALAALRPQHPDWETTVTQAKQWLQGAIAAGDRLQIGQGNGPVHHFYRQWQNPHTG